MGNTHNSNFEKSEISDLIKDIKITKIHLQNYNDKYHITQKQKEIKLEQIQNTNHILSNPKRNSSDGQILDGFCRSSLGKPMSSIDDIEFQRILSSKEFLDGIDLHWTCPI